MSRPRSEASAVPHTGASPFSSGADGVVFARVRVTPRARRAGVEGLVADAAGRVALKIAVTAPPADGAANAAVVALLAREWRVPKSALSVVAGAGSRSKTIALAGGGEAAAGRLLAWSERLAPGTKAGTKAGTEAGE